MEMGWGGVGWGELCSWDLCPLSSLGAASGQSLLAEPRDIPLVSHVFCSPGPLASAGKGEVTGGQIVSGQVVLFSACPRLNLKWTRRAVSFR